MLRRLLKPETSLLELLNNAGVLHSSKWENDKLVSITTAITGYKHMDHYGVEQLLIKYGYRMVNEEFDPMCGKTFGTYKLRGVK